MKVRELIAELSKFDPDALAVTACYEFGFTPIKKIGDLRVVRASALYSDQATHILADNSDDQEAEHINAVCLGTMEPGLVENSTR